MDQQDGNVVPVCQIFEDTDVLVVGICFVPSRANALEGIDDYQTNSRTLRNYAICSTSPLWSCSAIMAKCSDGGVRSKSKLWIRWKLSSR